MAVRDNHFSDDEAFTGKQGLNIAVAFTSFSSEGEMELSQEYGEIQFEFARWAIAHDGTISFDT